MLKANDLTQIMLESRKKRLLSNCYSPNVLQNVRAIHRQDNSSLLVCEDHGVLRLYFFVEHLNMLPLLLKQLETGSYYFEYITKEPQLAFPEGPWETEARLMRFVNADCRTVFAEGSDVLQYRNDQLGETALPEDASEVNALLWNVFRTEISHLLSDTEMESVIRQKEVMIHRTSGKVDAVLQTKIQPCKFYINQILNRADRSVIHAMLLKRLAYYVQGGGKYMYAWIEEQNLASLKFHRKYGMQHDGYWNLVFHFSNE